VATDSLAESWVKVGECAGRERILDEILVLLDPLGREETFGGATAAFHELLYKILTDRKSSAYREGVSRQDALSTKLTELRNKMRSIQNEKK
jgi:hypothetical protein